MVQNPYSCNDLDESLEPAAEDVLDMLRRHGLSAGQAQEVLTHVLQNLAYNAKL
jgi:hypothetical protein